MPFSPRTLGATGLSVGPLGLGASFGIGGYDLEWAVDQGVNYLYWGSLRRSSFGRGLRTLCRTRHGSIALVIQSYARVGLGVRVSLEVALRRLRTDHADVLLLGWWNGRLWESIWEAAVRLREQGKARFIAVSTHDRLFAGKIVAKGVGTAVDIVHVRYNAAHRGAEHEVFPHRVPGGPGLVSFTATRWGTLLRPRSNLPRVPTAGDCYRFALSHSAVDLCLAGPRNGEDLREAVAALARGPMNDEEIAWMRSVGDTVYGRPAGLTES